MPIKSGVKALNGTNASNRLRNSGLNIASTALRPRCAALWATLPAGASMKPIGEASISRTPALEVMIRTTFLKSALRPVLSVSVP